MIRRAPHDEDCDRETPYEIIAGLARQIHPDMPIWEAYEKTFSEIEALTRAEEHDTDMLSAMVRGLIKAMDSL